jgi:hypothetical protein
MPVISISWGANAHGQLVWLVLTGETLPSAEIVRRFHTFRTTYLIPNCSIITVYLRPGRDPRVLGASTTHLPRSLRTGG